MINICDYGKAWTKALLLLGWCLSCFFGTMQVPEYIDETNRCAPSHWVDYCVSPPSLSFLKMKHCVDYCYHYGVTSWHTLSSLSDVLSLKNNNALQNNFTSQKLHYNLWWDLVPYIVEKNQLYFAKSQISLIMRSLSRDIILTQKTDTLK